MFKNELSFRNHNNALKVAKALLDEDYVVLLSYEEELLIINYEWSENNADRNDMVFMSKYEYEEELSKQYDDIIHDIEKDIKEGYITSLDFFKEVVEDYLER